MNVWGQMDSMASQLHIFKQQNKIKYIFQIQTSDADFHILLVHHVKLLQTPDSINALLTFQEAWCVPCYSHLQAWVSL